MAIEEQNSSESDSDGSFHSARSNAVVHGVAPTSSTSSLSPAPRSMAVHSQSASSQPNSRRRNFRTSPGGSGQSAALSHMKQRWAQFSKSDGGKRELPPTAPSSHKPSNGGREAESFERVNSNQPSSSKLGREIAAAVRRSVPKRHRTTQTPHSDDSDPPCLAASSKSFVSFGLTRDSVDHRRMDTDAAEKDALSGSSTIPDKICRETGKKDGKKYVVASDDSHASHGGENARLVLAQDMSVTQQSTFRAQVNANQFQRSTDVGPRLLHDSFEKAGDDIDKPASNSNEIYDDLDDWADDFGSESSKDEDDGASFESSGVFENDVRARSGETARYARSRRSNFTTGADSVGKVEAERTSRGAADTLRLRAFDGDDAASVSMRHIELPCNDVIGIYADPLAQKDDWADDFELDDRREGRWSSQSNDRASAPVTAVLALLARQATERTSSGDGGDDFHSADEDLQADSVSTSTKREDDSLTCSQDIHGVQVDAKEERLYQLDWRRRPECFRIAEAVSTLSYGFEDGDVDPCCHRFLDVCSRHLTAIETHLESVRADRVSTLELENAGDSVYSYTTDPDAACIGSAADLADMPLHILLWKLEYARLRRDVFSLVCCMIALGRVELHAGKLDCSLSWLDNARAELESSRASGCEIDTLRIEIQFELARVKRTCGELENAALVLGRALDLSLALASSEESMARCDSSEQRGLWWALQCKFMLGEILLEENRFHEAIKHFVEYALEALARMIGLIEPSQPHQETVGSSLLRYCLFKPRQLALSMWAPALCLAELGHCEAAAAMGNMAMRTSVALGVEDVRTASIEFCSRARTVVRDAVRHGKDNTEDLPDGSSSLLANFEAEVGLLEASSEGDWDLQIEQELDITIQRCSEYADGYSSLSGKLPNQVSSVNRLQNSNMESNGMQISSEKASIADAKITDSSEIHVASSHVAVKSPRLRGGIDWTVGIASTSLHFAESELRQYLSRLFASVLNIDSHQMMYPKPTEPFHFPPLGPRAHEQFLREYVRSHVTSGPLEHMAHGDVNKGSHRTTSLRVKGPSPEEHGVCTHPSRQAAISAMEKYRRSVTGMNRLSPEFVTTQCSVYWEVTRACLKSSEKKAFLKEIILLGLSDSNFFAPRRPGPAERELRSGGLSYVSSFINIFKSAVDYLADDGSDAEWIFSAVQSLMRIAATLTPAAKATVELLKAELRAHCGLRRTVPESVLDFHVTQSRTKQNVPVSNSFNTVLVSSVDSKPGMPHSASTYHPDLCQSVVDVLHGLYWRTKAEVDDSISDPDSVERVVHADVASSLYLIGCGLSPINGSSLNVPKDEACLQLRQQHAGLIDDTRRVKLADLIADLQDTWSELSGSPCETRAKVCFALAMYYKADIRDSARTERLLFDGLLEFHRVASSTSCGWRLFPGLSFHAAPLAIISSPLSICLLHEYGMVALKRSKYRYGIAALEASIEGRSICDTSESARIAYEQELVEIAMSHHDWRRSLVHLYDLRDAAHPKNGCRNRFMYICTQLHRICADAGYFNAAYVPLKAYAALAAEEQYRALLHIHKDRLAKKRRKRWRYKAATSALPSIFPKSRSVAHHRSPFLPFARRAGMRVRPQMSSNTPSNRPSPVFDEESEYKRRSSALVAPAQSRTSGWNGLATRIFWGLARSPSVRFAAAATSAAAAAVNRPSLACSDRNERMEIAKLQGRSGKVESSPEKATSPRNQNTAVAYTEEDETELLALAAEQEPSEDNGTFIADLMKANLAFERGAYNEADSICRALLDLKLPLRGSRYSVLEIIARVRLKRREISRCLEVLDQMELESKKIAPQHVNHGWAVEAASGTFPALLRNLASHSSMHISRGHYNAETTEPSSHEHIASGSMSASHTPFFPEIAYLRLSALLHGGRLHDALAYADICLQTCPDNLLRHKAQLHYMRGRILFAMCSSATAPFDGDDITGSPDVVLDAELGGKYIEFCLSAFETASGFFDSAGDEVGTLKADLKWAQAAIDALFRKVVMPHDSGGGMSLSEACRLCERTIVFADLLEVVHSAISFSSTLNHPFLMIEAMASLAEVKCIQGESSASWWYWVSEAWKLFARLLTDPTEHKVVVRSVAPASTLLRLKNLCGRLVRLVLCSTHTADVDTINQHLGIFEAYITLQLDIDRKMNLASGSIADEDNAVSAGESSNCRDTSDQMQQESETNLSIHAPPDLTAQNNTETAKTKPAGAFLHVLGDQSVAIGKQGISVFINRPRQQVMNAVRGTGAGLLSTRLSRKDRSDKHGEDNAGAQMRREYIFPFLPELGMGAMFILDNSGSADSPPGRSLPSVGANHRAESMTAQESTGFTDQPSGDVSVRRRSTYFSACAESDMERNGNRPCSGKAENSSGGNRKVELESGKVDNSNPDQVITGGVSTAENTQSQEGGEISCIEEKTNRTHYPITDSSRDLALLVAAVRDAQPGDTLETACLGNTTGEKVWAYMHRLSAEMRRYRQGEITCEELGSRNAVNLRLWLRSMPRTHREWSIPDVLGKRLVYILQAHGVIGYYSVDRGCCVVRVEFGGKQRYTTTKSAEVLDSALMNQKTRFVGKHGKNSHAAASKPRPPTDGERKYLYDLVKDAGVRDAKWHKDRECEVVSGLSSEVFLAPRALFGARSSAVRRTQRSRPVVLVADLTLQIVPWELLLDHVVVRSLSLLDAVRGLQPNSYYQLTRQDLHEAKISPTAALGRKIVRFISFVAPRREGTDLSRSEEARRQQLGFQALLKMNHVSPYRLIAGLELGGFSDPTALNAVARPTGPLSTPLGLSQKSVKVLGVRVDAPFKRRHSSRVEIVKVSGLGSASTADLKEAALLPVPKVSSEKEPERRELGAYITVFLFTYADLVDTTESVFGLLRAIPRCLLIFTPAAKLKVVVKHLEDDELETELQQASGRRRGRIVPDLGASTRVIVEYVSRFSRTKLIPIVTFLGEGLVDVFSHKRSAANARRLVARS